MTIRTVDSRRVGALRGVPPGMHAPAQRASKLAAAVKPACANVILASLPRELHEQMVAHATARAASLVKPLRKRESGTRTLRCQD
jgi:hypothetical protein